MLRAYPAAHVTVDGTPRGDTPLRLELDEGEHQVQLACDRLLPDCESGMEAQQTVRVQAGQVAEVTQRWPH